ncbi:MAG: hypothetical protein ACKVKF_07420, partial [Rhodobacterales bacterium]
MARFVTSVSENHFLYLGCFGSQLPQEGPPAWPRWKAGLALRNGQLFERHRKAGFGLQHDHRRSPGIFARVMMLELQV